MSSSRTLFVREINGIKETTYMKLRLRLGDDSSGAAERERTIRDKTDDDVMYVK